MVLVWLQNKNMKKRIYLLQSGTLKREDNNVVFIDEKNENQVEMKNQVISTQHQIILIMDVTM